MAKYLYAKSLKEGEIVKVFNWKEKQKDGEFIVEKVEFSEARSGRGGMDEGNPASWSVSLRKLKKGKFDPKARIMQSEYDNWSREDSLHLFQKTGKKMKKVWVPA